ncbi:MAG TPA: hypothetical protein V6C76_12055 [Drouetiella sp.]
MAQSVPTTIDLLSECFSLEAEQLAVLNLACIESGMEPGEYMFRQGNLNPAIIRGAVLCQMYMHEKLLTKPVTISAMKILGAQNCTIEEALAQAGWDFSYYENVRQLRDLLLDSGLISDKDKTLAFATCLNFQIPFLSTLVQRNALTADAADYVLSIQEKLLLQEIAYEEAIEFLSRCEKPDGKIAKPEVASRPVTKEIEVFKGSRLGELLVASTIITPLQLVSALEEGRRKGKLTGEVLISQGSLSEVDLKRVLNAQGRVENGSLTFDEAVGKLDPKRVLPP